MCAPESTSKETGIKYTQVTTPVADIITYSFWGAEFIKIETKTHYTDTNTLQLIVDKFLSALESQIEVKLQPRDSVVEVRKQGLFIPLYVYECDEDFTCGLSYKAAVPGRLVIEYAYYEPSPGKVIVHYEIGKTENERLTDEEIKFAAYLFAYTHYCMGNKYGENIHYSVGFGYNRLSDIGYIIPLGYIYKVNVPFIDMDEFERLIETLQVRFGSGWNTWVNAILGLWQINGITNYQSGTPLSIATGTNTAGIFNPRLLANNNGRSGKISGDIRTRLSRYFDTSVFSQPPPFTFGNTTPSSPDLRSPAVRNWDLSVFKEFQLPRWERGLLQFRAEAFNALNAVRFGSPNTNVASRDFGRITTQANTPRQIQFGLKLLF